VPCPFVVSPRRPFWGGRLMWRLGALLIWTRASTGGVTADVSLLLTCPFFSQHAPSFTPFAMCLCATTSLSSRFLGLGLFFCPLFPSLDGIHDFPRQSDLYPRSAFCRGCAGFGDAFLPWLPRLRAVGLRSYSALCFGPASRLQVSPFSVAS